MKKIFIRVHELPTKEHPNGKVVWRTILRPDNVFANALPFLQAEGTYELAFRPDDEVEIVALLPGKGEPIMMGREQVKSEETPKALDRLIKGVNNLMTLQ